jgi:hypothetical protein
MIWSLQAISTFRKLVTNIQLNFKVRLNTLNMPFTLAFFWECFQKTLYLISIAGLANVGFVILV